jgi:hypothetical protein
MPDRQAPAALRQYVRVEVKKIVDLIQNAN